MKYQKQFYDRLSNAKVSSQHIYTSNIKYTQWVCVFVCVCVPIIKKSMNLKGES